MNEYKQTKEEIERLNLQNELILKAAGEGIFGLNLEGRVMFVNPVAAKILGYEAGELIGEIHHHKVHHSRQDGTPYPEEQCPIYAAYKDGITYRGTNEVFWKRDGTSIPIEYLSTPIIEKGKLKGAVVTFNDLSEKYLEMQELEEKYCHLEYLWTSQKNTLEALHETEAKFSTLFQESRDAIYITTKEGSFVEINKSALDLFGYTREEMLKLKAKELYAHPEDRDTFQKMIEQHGSIKNFEVTLLKKDGAEIDCLLTSTLRTDKEGNILGYHGIIHDITERKSLENQLYQAQKMEAVGQLAGGVAHDFNNILTIVIGYADLLQMEMNKDDPLRNDITQILNAAQRGANLTLALLTLSRKQIISPKSVNLNEIIKVLGKLLFRLIGEDIELSLQITNRDLIIMADTSQIDQVLMNLVTNARDAMPDGGRLTVRTDLVNFHDDFITAHGYGKPGTYALISVEDTGQGMDSKTKERIFEPFFTTKEAGKGTGLGLAMVYGIVKQHEGYIIVASEPGKGTIFKIYLPLIQSAVQELQLADIPLTVQGSETILLAEDDSQVRELTKRVLEKYGYKVIEAIDGFDAMRVFTDNKESIQLLILDVIMPKKSGKECYDEIKKIKPDMKAIFISGYTADIVRGKGILKEGSELIFKPVSPNELLGKVRELLNRQTPLSI
ncbi:MAG: PAS domain S-box protein [Thermodesulfovibrionales bacterium]